MGLEYGGPAQVVRTIAALPSGESDMTVATVGASGTNDLRHSNVGVHVSRAIPGPLAHFGISAGLAFWLLRNVKKFDVIVIHGVFDFPALASMVTATLRRTNWVLRPYGSLEQSDINKHRALKWLLGRVLLTWLLPRASFVWFTSKEESQAACTFGSQPRMKIIPLPVEDPRADQQLGLELRRELGIDAETPLILYMSRIAPKKRLESLIEAVASPDLERTHLVVAGTGAPNYVSHMRALQDRYDLGHRIHWYGWADAEAKRALLGGADIFVLNSETENFGVAAAEAAAAGVATVLSSGVDIALELAELEGTCLVDGSTEALAHAIKMLSDDEERRRSVANAARDVWYARWRPSAVAARYAKELIA